MLGIFQASLAEWLSKDSKLEFRHESTRSFSRIRMGLPQEPSNRPKGCPSDKDEQLEMRREPRNPPINARHIQSRPIVLQSSPARPDAQPVVSDAVRARASSALCTASACVCAGSDGVVIRGEGRRRYMRWVGLRLLKLTENLPAFDICFVDHS
jgi:hypothetical protein